MSDTTTETKPVGKSPSHVAWHVREGGNGKSYWNRIGVAWTNKDGEALRFEDLVRYEVNAPINDAACGGTHRLFGLKWVANLHARKSGQPMTSSVAGPGPS